MAKKLIRPIRRKRKSLIGAHDGERDEKLYARGTKAVQQSKEIIKLSKEIIAEAKATVRNIEGI